MTEKMVLVLLLVPMLWVFVGAEFECLCNNHVQLRIHETPTVTGAVVGFLYGDDCVPTTSPSHPIPRDWLAIVYGNAIGYVEKDIKTPFLKCGGTPDPYFILPTTLGTKPTTPKTTTRRPKTTTRRPTTAGPKTTTGKTTPRSTTVEPFIRCYHGPRISGQYGTMCYVISHNATTWYNAEQNCFRHGGHLAHIANAGQQAFILKLLRASGLGNSALWIGLNDRFIEDDFIWSSGNQVTYSHWLPSARGTYHDVEDCVVFVPYQYDGGWDEVHCGTTTPAGQDTYSVYRWICQFGYHENNHFSFFVGQFIN